MAARCDAKRLQQVPITVGSYVMLNRTGLQSKTEPKRDGPFLVSEIGKNDSYRLKAMNDEDFGNSPSTRLIVINKNRHWGKTLDDHFEVDEVLGERLSNGKKGVPSSMERLRKRPIQLGSQRRHPCS